MIAITGYGTDQVTGRSETNVESSTTAQILHWQDPHLRADWTRLTEKSGKPSAFFQSPQWFEHLGTIVPEAQLTVALRNSLNETVGVVGLHWEADTLDYYVGGRTFWKANLHLLDIPGGDLLLPANAEYHDSLIETLYSAFPNCDA